MMSFSVLDCSSADHLGYVMRSFRMLLLFVGLYHEQLFGFLC